jgi:hypothetical protein
MNMNSVERVEEYCLAPQERYEPDGPGPPATAPAAPSHTTLSPRAAVPRGQRPALPANWPAHGAVAFEGVTLRYRPDTPAVLNRVTFTAEGERFESQRPSRTSPLTAPSLCPLSLPLFQRARNSEWWVAPARARALCWQPCFARWSPKAGGW